MFEIASLLAAIALGLVHIATASFAYKAQVGQHYTMGARDEERAAIGRAGRLLRAQRNFQETFAFFAAAVLVVIVTGLYGWASQLGCALYLAGRVVYLPLYALGRPPWRSVAWRIATAGIVLVAVQPLLRWMMIR